VISLTGSQDRHDLQDGKLNVSGRESERSLEFILLILHILLSCHNFLVGMLGNFGSLTPSHSFHYCPELNWK